MVIEQTAVKAGWKVRRYTDLEARLEELRQSWRVGDNARRVLVRAAALDVQKEQEKILQRLEVDLYRNRAGTLEDSKFWLRWAYFPCVGALRDYGVIVCTPLYGVGMHWDAKEANRTGIFGQYVKFA